MERETGVREGTLKAQVAKVREEKLAVEKQLFDTEFLLGEKASEISKLKDDFVVQKQSLTDRIKELEDKVSFFRQNQRLLSEDDNARQTVTQDYQALKDKVRRLEEDARKAKDLEKKCRLLEETLKSKNPNSIPMMLQTVKDSEASDKAEVKDLKQRIKQLEVELDEKDKDYDRKLRTMRQETERVREGLEGKKGPEAKKIAELEKEIESTKAYYTKRIREIEEKAGKAPAPKKPQTANAKPPKPLEVVDTKQLEEAIDKLTKERNLLA